MPLQSAIAPSVVITRKQRPPISSTGRDGSASPPPSECADAPPRREVIHSAASQSATPTARLSTRGSTPAAPASDDDPGRGEAADAPAAVERRHDRLAQLALDRDAVGVHRDVHHAVGRAEHEQDRAEHRRARRQQRERQHQAVDERRHTRDRAARAAVEHVPGQRHRDQRAGGHAEQAEADRRLRHAELLLEPRDVRDPGADHRAVDRERAERRDARRHADRPFDRRAAR